LDESRSPDVGRIADDVTKRPPFPVRINRIAVIPSDFS